MTAVKGSGHAVDNTVVNEASEMLPVTVPPCLYPGSAEWQDAPLAAAEEYLAQLEEDPTTDELTIAMARNEVMLRRRELTEKIAATLEGS